jgi:hypothetical protein
LVAYTADGHQAACHFPLRDPEAGVGRAVDSSWNGESGG